LKNNFSRGLLESESFSELQGLVKWFNLHGFEPVVVGGWAAFYYHKKQASTDIDLVVPSKRAVDLFDKKYAKKKGFERMLSERVRINFKKQVDNETIELDIFTHSHKNALLAFPEIAVPWRLCEKYSEKWRLGKNCNARIPKKELLVLYKTAALIDRREKIRRTPHIALREKLKSKIEKDKEDINQLLSLQLDTEVLGCLLKKTGFERLFHKTVEKINSETRKGKKLKTSN